jgi:hypothetical protein
VNSVRPRPAPLLSADASANALPGRLCPADYRCDPAVFDREPEIAAEVLYVVGGLYGNGAALAAVEQMAEAERAPVIIVFNGDFHWFDAEPAWFGEIDRRVARHLATRGNVETEIGRRDDIGAGCGCAYPGTVDDATVARSNEILRHLRRTAAEAAAPARLAALPMHLVAAVAGLRIGIVHGDAVALAGWRFTADSLDNPANRSWLGEVRARSHIDVFASTHTCAAALRAFELSTGSLTVINNGAAGMPNFAGIQFGLISRISPRPSPHPPLYGIARDGVFIDALPVGYDTAAFLDGFLARWPAGSAAHRSYFRRIVEGPDYTVATARPA